MSKIALVIVLLFFMACNVEKSLKLNINGIWVPELINWEDGNFNTFYVYNDTSFIILSSTQKYLSDSMNFQAEPGFILRHGAVLSIDINRANIESRVLYRYISLPGDSTPSAIQYETLSLETEGKIVSSFELKGIKYLRTDKYTNQSVNTIKNIATHMVPDLKKKLE